MFHRLPISVLTAFLTASVLLVSGCQVALKPLTRDEIVTTNEQDRFQQFQDMPGIEHALTLEEAIARGLKYNLDHRIKMMEVSLAAGQLEAGKYDMLPRLLANAGYEWRDKDNIREAQDSVTGLPSLANPYISAERSHTVADLGLHWNIIDFGVGYYNARENANRVLIAEERRRKAMHILVQHVRTAFWRALAAAKLESLVGRTLEEAEYALDRSRQISAAKIQSPEVSLRYQRNLLENLRLLENVDRELKTARIELASLIGISPGTRLELVEPADYQLQVAGLEIDEMERVALVNNADLRERHYDARNAVIETRRALVKLIPNLSFVYAQNYDDDDFLINNNWANAGLRVSFNLFNLLSGPKRIEAAELGVQLAETKRMALQMSVLTQVHLANRQYQDAMRQYRRADAIFSVDTLLAELANNREKSGAGAALNRISSNVTSILSTVRRYHAVAKVHEADSRIQATLGQESYIGSLDDIDLETLQDQVRENLEQWRSTLGSQGPCHDLPLTAVFAEAGLAAALDEPREIESNVETCPGSRDARISERQP